MPQNAANRMVMPFVSEVAISTVLELFTQGHGEAVGNLIEVKVTVDRESAGEVDIDVEESADGSTWNAVGTTTTVAKGGAAVFAGSTGKYIRVRATNIGNGTIIMSTDYPTQHVSQLP